MSANRVPKGTNEFPGLGGMKESYYIVDCLIRNGTGSMHLPTCDTLGEAQDVIEGLQADHPNTYDLFIIKKIENVVVYKPEGK